MTISGQTLAAIKIGDVPIMDQPYSFFAVPNPKIVPTTVPIIVLNQANEEENLRDVLSMTAEKKI